LDLSIAQPLERRLESSPTISLSSVLQNYHLKPKMKASLAYIVARSVWQFYDRDWMKTEWNGTTIEFLREVDKTTEDKLYVWKPYFAATFIQREPKCMDYCDATGKIHQYPRVLALGVMLVEIGLGCSWRTSNEEVSAHSQLNGDWIWAMEKSQETKAWPDFDYPQYRNAVKNCLNNELFKSAPYQSSPEQDKQQYKEGLDKRRQILYEQVIHPLEALVEGTGWADDFANIEPLQSKPERVVMSYSSEQRIMCKHEGIVNATTRKASSLWLERMDYFNKELFASSGSPKCPADRIRIAVLDTGFDCKSPFFQFRDRRSRLGRHCWKDWVEDSPVPKDIDGHGTHIVGLVMRIAPQADVFVARVAQNKTGLLAASDIVAEVQYHFRR